MRESQYYLLIHKSLSGQISAKEKQGLNRWLELDRSNLQLYNELKFIWELPLDFDEPDEDHVRLQHARLIRNLKELRT